jgi:amino acid adenylation domain-containing protein
MQTSNRKISDLRAAHASEQRQVLEGNATEVPFPLDQDYTTLFEAQAAANPDAPAVRSQNQEWTYAELNRRANCVAHHLRRCGIGPETLIGIFMERSLEMTSALLGVLKSGAAFLPLDPADPQERLDYVISDSGASVVLTQKHLVSRLRSHEVKIVVIDELIELPEGRSPVCPARPENLAYVIYTSGSTGKSKGVEITRRSLINHSLAMAGVFDLDPADRVLQFTALSFDVSIEELLPSWLSGCAVVIRSEDALASVAQFLRFIETEDISVLNLPTAFWHAIVDSLPTVAIPKCVRLLVVGGEKASAEHYRVWREHVGARIRLINAYGLAETTITNTVFVSDSTRHHDTFPIGQPIANTQAYIVDTFLQPVPVGEIGELYIGGEGVARGYRNRPELTAERFPIDPFGNRTGRLYKTGDLARRLSDGNIEFVGRTDDQVKVRGFRIEVAEVEAALVQHAKIRQCVVGARAWGDNEKRLVGWFIPASENPPSAGELIAFLKGKLPEYMIPSAFVPVPSFPTRVSGKVDRAALPLPGAVRPELEQSYVAPRSTTEEQLAKIWTQVLGVEPIGVHDNFFDLGGHSLHAMQVVARMGDLLEIDMPLATLFQTPTIAALAGLVAAEGVRHKPRSPNPVLPAPRAGTLPLSFAQQRLWFLHQLEPNSPLYNLPHSLRITGAVNQQALEAAFLEVISRHEALRTTLVTVDGEPRQRIDRISNFKLPLVDLSHQSSTGREAELKRLSLGEARKPFDLTRDLMVRAKLVRMAETEHILLVTFHHVACDGWSVELFWNELLSAYEAATRQTAARLPPLPVQYADFAEWQRNWVTGEVLREQLDYWKHQLADTPPLLELPTDRPRSALQSSAGARYVVQFQRPLVNGLKALSQQHNCTLFMTVLAGFHALLARYSGGEDIIVGTVVANRNRPELEHLIGFFANTLVLRADLSGDPSFSKMLARIRCVTLDAYAHQDVPFEKLVEELRPVRDRSYHPLFQAMLVLQNVPSTEQRTSGLSIMSSEIDTGTAMFDLLLNLSETDDTLAGYLQYSTDLYEPESISRMVKSLESLLEDAVRNPDARLSQLRMLGEGEREQLLVEWNHTQSAYPKDRTWMQLFEEQVARTPQATALVFGQQRLSYQQLNQHVNQLAHHLRGLGAGPESLVAICAERSIEMVVAILAVLKAGGAYLPMDPLYPAERLSFMLEDAQTSVVLTQQKIQREWRINTKVLNLDRLDLKRERTDNPARLSKPENLSHVIYTSGSTGRPKGVALEHRSLNAFAHWAKELYTSEELNGVLAGTSICFDLSVFELLVPLCWGGKVILANNVLQLPELPAVNEVRLINTVPSAATELVRLKAIPPGVRVINLAGEPLRQDLVEQLYALGTVKKVYDLYGPTEDTVYSTGALRQPGGRATIGRPLANKQVYILDEQMEPVPVGVAGQLYIGGDGLARGYLHRPELTAERFIQSPWGHRVYRTGDLARYQWDGNIEFIGRADHQVKIRGFRIELGEIEAQLRQHAQVREAVVVAREEAGEKRLVAYVVADATLGITDLKEHLKKRLPDYMVPAAIVVLEKLPLTPNDKVDRKALPAPDLAAIAGKDFTPPETDIERLLGEMWCDVLNLKRVGIHDNFFELGGHSLMVIKLISRLRDAIQVELPMASVFEAPTIAQLALLIEDILIREIDELPADGAEQSNETLVQSK